MTDAERLQQIQEKFAKLGWMPREDIGWLMETLAQIYKNQEENGYC